MSSLVHKNVKFGFFFLGLTGGVGEEDGSQILGFVWTGFINRNLPFLSDSLHKNAVSFFLLLLLFNCCEI